MSVAADDESTQFVGRQEPPDRGDRALRWLALHGAPYATALLCLLTLALFSNVFRGEMIGDDLTFHFAESARIADCIRGGDWDFWNPSANAGFASAYYYQLVPQLISALPAALFGHHLFFFQLSVVLPFVIGPWCAYRGMRRMGSTPWQAFAAAFVLAYAIGESRWGFGPEGTFRVGLLTQGWALAIFPLALGHAVRWAREARGLAPAVLWGALVGLCHPFCLIGLGLALFFAFVAQAIGALFVRPLGRRHFGNELFRLAVYAVLLAITQLPTLVPLVVDYVGFGGFPHRVADEVGPGFVELGRWAAKGMLFDHHRAKQVGPIVTALLPIALVCGRGPHRAWLWVPVFVLVLLLGIGPHIGKTGSDDLFPAVRFLGVMQTCAALAIGAGLFGFVAWLWEAPDGSRRALNTRRGILLLVVAACGFGVLAVASGWVDGAVIRITALLPVETPWLRRMCVVVLLCVPVLFVSRAEVGMRSAYGLRTGIAAAVAVIGVLVMLPAVQYQQARIRVLPENDYRDELIAINQAIARLPQGRKQVGPGVENHWWNLLGYVYDEIPALLQMGGAGLQASPNYDFVWSVRDFTKLAWTYDTPYFVYDQRKSKTPPPGEEIFAIGEYRVRRLPSPGLVTPVEITGTIAPGGSGAGSETRKTAIEWLRGTAPTSNQHLAYDGFGAKGPPPAATVRRVWRQDSPGDEADIVAQLEVAQPSTLVVRESWHPRWHAFVDGKEVPVRRVTPDFPAVDVPAGATLLQLRFQRPWWAQLVWLAVLVSVLLGWAIDRLGEKLSSRGASRPGEIRTGAVHPHAAWEARS